MAEERVQRRLAAIMAADVVGFSRLMEGDEAGTLKRLKLLRRDLVGPKTAEFGGRIFKLTGDGALAEFGSAADAVNSAVAIQRALSDRNADLPDGQHVELRIGISLGDVIVEGSDLYGNGVNVAARMEGLADPGGICVSANVQEHVRNAPGIAFTDLGDQQVKNISRPVRAYKIELNEPARRPSTGDGASAAPDKPSIAVLPFDNMSGDPEQEFFVDGLAEDIITALSKIERMRVIARNSTFAYKGQARDLRQIAEELGVRYVLEGSVRRGGNRLRITAQLIDAGDGSHLWAERYDRTVDDLFDIQDEITKEIVTALRVKLTDGDRARAWARGTNNIEAWQNTVRAMEVVQKFTLSSYREARELAEKATELDPNYALAWAALGLTYWFEGRLDYAGQSDDAFRRADEFARHAMALDDSVAWAAGVSAVAAAPMGRFDEAIAMARRGFDLNPGNADVRGFLAFALMQAGNYREAAEHFRAAIALNPFPPPWYRVTLARVLLALDEFDEAEALFRDVLNTTPDNILAWLFLAYIYGQTGRQADAANAIGEVHRIAPNMRVSHMPKFLQINDEAAVQRFMEGVRAAGLPE